MFPFVGYGMFIDAAELAETNKQYIADVFAKFPVSFQQKTVLLNGPLCLAGNFASLTEASEQHHSLYFNGDIFNAAEIAARLSVALKPFPGNAALALALILKKGIEAVAEINGQFLIIYFNKQAQQLYIINDHFGIAQLYYYHDKNGVLFGSEIKYLLAHPHCPKEIDWETALKRPFPNTLTCYKSYKTWFSNVNLLPEASLLHIDLQRGRTKIKSYWTETLTWAFEKDGQDKRTATDIMEEYISLLDDAIKIRMADQDVCHALLSGGLDSSAIAALAATHKRVETFSIITQTTWLEGTTTICNNLQKDLRIKNVQYLVPVHKLFFNGDLWKQRIWRAESPVNHTDFFTKTILHYAIKKKHPNVNTLLTGTGSDQLNGGLVRWLVHDATPSENAWEKFHDAIVDIENHTLVSRADTALWDRRIFINRDFLASVSGAAKETNTWRLYVDSALHANAYSLLWDEVRASVYHRHITRFPFLDFRFLPFISKIPSRLHRDLFFDKAILRVPLRKTVPEYVTEKPKAPIVVPEYDFRFRLFDFITATDSMAIVEEALCALDQPHPVINKRTLVDRIKKMQAEPEIYEWLDIMHIINVGLLQQLPGKTEADMDMESAIGELQEVTFEDAGQTTVFLENTLTVKEKIDLQKPLLFTEGALLLFNRRHNKYFLAKDNVLQFEVEEDYRDWIRFLNAVNNQMSTRQLLDELKIEYGAIEEFLNISVEAKLLTTQECL